MLAENGHLFGRPDKITQKASTVDQSMTNFANFLFPLRSGAYREIRAVMVRFRRLVCYVLAGSREVFPLCEPFVF
jgi:hypothetical protein